VYQAEPESKQIRAFVAAIGLDYDTLTKEEFVSIISGLKKSKHLKSPISQRGKTEETLKQRRRCGATRAVYTFASAPDRSKGITH